MSRDKIFDNNYGKQEIDGTRISFQTDKSFESRPAEEQIDEVMTASILDKKILMNKEMSLLIQESEEIKKLSKSQLNLLFDFCINQKEISSIEAFSYVSDKVEIKPDRLYENLSNSHKEILIAELKKRGYLIDGKNTLF